MLKKQYLVSIRKNKLLMFALMNHFDISISSLYRWLDKNERAFSEYGCLLLIAHHLKIENIRDLLETENNSGTEYALFGIRCIGRKNN